MTAETPIAAPFVIPGYWMNETSGRLALAVRAYLVGDELDALQISYMRAYLRQWMRGNWQAVGVDELRRDIDLATTSAAIGECIKRAVELGADPL